MIELGRIQQLQVIRETSIGVYLNSDKESSSEDVLLPKRQVPSNTQVGDKLNVFIYKDSEDRIIATTKTPKLTLDTLAMLEVIEVTRIGAFMNWGLDKDLFLPFTEQTLRIQKNKEYLVGLYVDKSQRLCATMNISKLLSSKSPYKKDDTVSGTVYSVKKGFGALVAVEDKYHGLIHDAHIYANYYSGQKVDVRVLKVREDGKLDLSPREKAYKQMDDDATVILKQLEQKGGFLPFNDKSSPEQIKSHFNMSKGAFKRAIGGLFKERKINITEKGIEKI